MGSSFLSKVEGEFYLTIVQCLDKLNYFFVIRIDHAHHATQPHLSLDETLEFDRAIALARSKLSDEDTLIVVTSDHSHTMTYAGYGVNLFNVSIAELQFLSLFMN